MTRALGWLLKSVMAVALVAGLPALISYAAVTDPHMSTLGHGYFIGVAAFWFAGTVWCALWVHQTDRTP